MPCTGKTVAPSMLPSTRSLSSLSICGMWPTSMTSRVSPIRASAIRSGGSDGCSHRAAEHGGERVTATPVRVNGLSCLKLPAMPDDCRLDPSPGRDLSEVLDAGTAVV